MRSSRSSRLLSFVLTIAAQASVAQMTTDISLLLLADDTSHDVSHRKLRTKTAKNEYRKIAKDFGAYAMSYSSSGVRRDFRHVWSTKKEKSSKHDQQYKTSKKEKGYTYSRTMPPTPWPTRSPTVRKNGVYVHTEKSTKGQKGSKGSKSIGKWKGKSRTKGKIAKKKGHGSSTITPIVDSTAPSVVPSSRPVTQIVDSTAPSVAPSSRPVLPIVDIITLSALPSSSPSTSQRPSDVESPLSSSPPSSSPAPSPPPSTAPSSLPTIPGTSSGTVTTTVV